MLTRTERRRLELVYVQFATLLSRNVAFGMIVSTPSKPRTVEERMSISMTVPAMPSTSMMARPVRGVLRRLPPAPLAHRRPVQVQLLRQRLGAFRAGADVFPDGRGGGGLLVQVDQHFSFALMSSGSPARASLHSRWRHSLRILSTGTRQFQHQAFVVPGGEGALFVAQALVYNQSSGWAGLPMNGQSLSISG